MSEDLESNFVKDITQKYKNSVSSIVIVISTCFTLQFIGISLLNSNYVLRILGGSLSMYGIIAPYTFPIVEREKHLAMMVSLCTLFLISNGYLCPC